MLGVIGGSGIYDIAGVSRGKRITLKTPFGAPSDSYLVGRLGRLDVCFLPRHGRGHRISPSEVNSRANIWGMKKIGVERLVSITAVGSLREGLAPGDVVVPDQLFDRTGGGRSTTFFGDGVVAHVQMADPTCAELADLVYASATAAGARAHKGGCHLCMEGPTFSTRAESRLHRSWGMDVVGMTVLPEAALAREAELCFSNLALVTDYDCWHETESDVSVPAVLEVLRANAKLANEIVRLLAEKADGPRTCPCTTALDGAIVTAPEAISPAARRRLSLLLGDRHAAPPKKASLRSRRSRAAHAR